MVAFALVAAIITVTPGIDTAVTVRTTLRHGRRAGVLCAVGVCAGLLLWGLATALGVSLLVTASRVAYDALRLAGAVWLGLLGVRTIVAARGHRPREVAGGTPGPPVRGRDGLAALRSGLVSNLLNPKIGVFYLTLLPQFVPPGARVLPTTMLLASVHAVEGIAWLSLVALLTARARAVLARGAARRALERVTGVVLIGFGLRVALERP